MDAVDINYSCSLLLFCKKSGKTEFNWISIDICFVELAHVFIVFDDTPFFVIILQLVFFEGE